MIGLIGISYKTSTVEVREQFSLAKEEIISFSELLQKETGISDLVVLSTCNRTEIYFSQDKYGFHLAAKLVYKTLKHFKRIENKYWHTFYSYADDDAVKHLFEVSSGIDSMIIGEDQIIGQIKEAYMLCTEAALTDAVLMRLFQKSFEAGKRVRTETRIKMGTTSVSGAAVQKCINLFSDLSNKRVLMIGAGETGSLVLQNFHKNGNPKITVTNRTEEKARKLSEKHNCTLLPFEQMPAHLFLYDIIIVATGSKVPLVTRKMVEESLKTRNNDQQVFIDISVPRNIDKKIEELAPVQLFTIDDFQKVISTNMEKRKDSIDTANEIIAEISTEFSEWLASRSLRPAIETITYNLQKVTKEELSGYNKVNSEEIQLAIGEFSKHMAQKYTRLFIKNLKEMTANGKKTETLKLVNELFSISE
ncbi:glutamyl-tRNA reductase [Mariniphaga anaerophila]|uniref:Glutamyl-tRNA reductase n=1 Tax=Mariniphaga anaerophila TaxID=1484053 RepID=A0A1M5EIC1_9BACT|nr:glutamyl-tRNA reductase [Mariniphaga anaerophila]SHF79018.1 glutamyl-tRNA reductase [Mariniphaga anaerophila]